jgi:hypothetical protein
LKKVVSNPVLDGPTIRYDLQKPFEVIAQMSGNENWRSQGDWARTSCARPPLRSGLRAWPRFAALCASCAAGEPLPRGLKARRSLAIQSRGGANFSSERTPKNQKRSLMRICLELENFGWVKMSVRSKEKLAFPRGFEPLYLP